VGWREREILEQRLFKLTVEHKVVASDDMRSLSASNREIEICVDRQRNVGSGGSERHTDLTEESQGGREEALPDYRKEEAQ
jgi:hypothetical protein